MRETWVSVGCLPRQLHAFQLRFLREGEIRRKVKAYTNWIKTLAATTSIRHQNSIGDNWI